MMSNWLIHCSNTNSSVLREAVEQHTHTHTHTHTLIILHSHLGWYPQIMTWKSVSVLIFREE